MGADLIITEIYFNTNIDNIKEIKKIKDSLKNNFDPQIWENYAFDVDLEYIPEDNKNLDDLKSHIDNTLSNLISARYSRQTVHQNYKNILKITTGGMSWGDPATDLQDSFWHSWSLPNSISEKIGLINPSLYELFIAQEGDKLPDKLKKQLEAWHLAKKV